MSLSASIAPHIPYLRRYARALTGSQQAGDGYVKAALEAVLSGQERLEPEQNPRLALYRLFHTILAKAAAQGPAKSHAAMNAVDSKLQALSPANREAMLLTATEGFSSPEVALVLNKSQGEIERDIVAAQAEIDKQLASRVLIIEDESIIAMDLENLMTALGHEVVGIAATRDEAIEQARTHKPGLVLADIRLADGSSGIDAASEILRGFDIPVIFITAYPERLLTGERPEPTYLITKPFLPMTVKATVGQALFFHAAKSRR